MAHGKDSGGSNKHTEGSRGDSVLEIMQHPCSGSQTPCISLKCTPLEYIYIARRNPGVRINSSAFHQFQHSGRL